ncbi:MAG TPA: LamG-like jellyroll fold domain-containing protein, partial [Thermoplasmata archaeon]|nr:LamG-like jellyroll fold domain-containing protein [Thermoplasmata archaeon]
SSFAVYLNANSSTSHGTETVGYVAIVPQANPNALATWTRAEVYVSGTTGTWTYPAAFAKAPLILAWMQGEASGGNKNIGLRLKSVTNISTVVYREQSGSAPADTIEFFAFAGPMNVTARMTTNPTVADTDGDTLLDGAEVNTYGSNPTVMDTDADGIPDNVEVTSRTMTIPVNGTLKTITATTSPTSPDTDADGIPDLQEIQGVLDHRVLYYDMATLSSGIVIRDLSGNGADGNLKYVQTSSTGKVGASILFNGTTGSSANRIQVPSAPWLNLTDGFSITAWVDLTTTTQIAGSAIVAKGYGTSASFVLDIVASGNNKVFRAYVNSPAHQVTSGTTIAANTWYLVTAVYDPARGTLSLYVNGNAPAATSGVPPITTNTHDVTIGSREWSTTSGYNMSFKGYLDEVQVWDRPISRAEVNATYNVTSAASYLTRLDFETLTSSGQLFDFAGGSHSGSITGTTVVEGRAGLARSLAGADGISLANPSTLSITSGVSLDVYVSLTAYPLGDASIVGRKGSFYLNVSSDGLVRWSAYKVASIASPLPVALGRWVRITATATGSALNLYLDGILVASWTGSATFQSTTNSVTLGYSEGQAHLSVALDEFTLMNSAASAWTVADSGPHGIQLNPNSTDTDADGLADGQEMYTYTVKTPSRYPIPDGSSKTTDSAGISLGAPAWAISKAVAMVGLTHPDMGQVSDNVYFRSGSKSLQSFALKSSGSNAGQSNNFTSYDLFQLGLSRATLIASQANAYLIAWDGSSDGKKGQIEYVQLEITVHTLPNRADTDRDGLNDSEEVNLGHDGFATNPWKADTDGDGIPDAVEVNGWSWSGSTIVNDTNGFHTDPARADTDRDGVPDGRDRAPLGDLFVEVSINSIVVTGSDSHNGGTPHPFVEASILGNNTYTPALSSASGSWTTTDFFTLFTYPGHRLSVNVPDDSTSVVVSFAAWSYDTRGYNNQVPIVVGSHTEYVAGVPTCVNDPTVNLAYSLQSPGQSTNYSLSGCSGTTPMYANPLSVTITTLIPSRASANLIVPIDYSGVYNVTDSSGNILSRRYTGESRFVALLLNATEYDSTFHCYCGPAQADMFLVPRSVFFNTRLYQYLNASNPISPLDKLSFRQNATSAGTNADDIQEILTGNVTSLDVSIILNLLTVNATGTAFQRGIALGNDLLFYSLPDGVVRLVGYRAGLTGISVAYTFCTSSCDPPTPKPWWEQVWDGLVSVATAFVTSAIVLAVNSFRMLVAVLGQVGNWFAQQIGNFTAAVASAVRAAGKALTAVTLWLASLVISAIENAIRADLQMLNMAWQASIGGIVDDLKTAVTSNGPQQSNALLSAVGRIGNVVLVFLALAVAIRAAEIAAAVSSMGISYLVTKIVSDSLVNDILVGIGVTALTIAASAVFSTILESVGWVDSITGSLVSASDKGADLVDKVGDTAKTLLSLLFVKYSAEFTLLKRWEGFALAFVGLLLAIASFFTPKGLGIAIIDFMSVGLGVLGVGYYFVESKNFAEQAADAPSTFGKDFELL